ncbi:hypothetical protein I9W82_005644 [Candida metapsilosis]|uniref:Uncharacterized protein n=1 Tax=Candida metapsilosis TaxID=273372 RepID=A0A8H8D8Q3_9ASCO|nr:hypothetical protein I9W82_005644 [Candida metapsilosis]
MAKMPKISLDQYPHDILFEIFSIAGVTNLRKLLNSTFLQTNPNIQQAINNVIIKGSTYKYDNATTPFKSEDYSIGSHWRTTDFVTIAEVQAFDDYCVENSIAIELEFSYLMRTILDWIEMEKLLKCLKAGKFVKRQLKIDLSESDYTLDLNKLPSLIGPIKERFIGLSIDSSPLGSSVGAIDLEYLRDIEVLQLDGCDIKGSFSQYHHLRELDYTPSDEQEYSIDLQKLPPTLQRLHLHSCDCIEGVTDQSAQFPSLESISVSYEGPDLPSWVKDILRLMTCNKTTNIEYDGEEDSADEEFLELLLKEARIKGFKLDSLKLDTTTESKLQLLPSRRFVQAGMQDENWHPSELPSTLQEIRLDSLELSSSKQILQYFPTSLVKLELIDGADIDWSDSDLDFSKFSNLKTLTLEGCATGDCINSFTFPDSLEEMDLSYNSIEAIDDVKFPKKLKRLVMSGEEIEEICETPFPRSLKELDLSESVLKNVDLVFNKFGEALQIDVLDLRGNSFLWLSKCKLPGTLRFLALERCIQDEALHFGDNLRVLNLSGCEFQKLNEVTFGSSLTSLDLRWCKLKHFSMKLPESLEEIDLSGNSFKEVPVQLCNLRNLKIISMSYNNIKSVNLNFTSSALEVFNMNWNKIKEIQLTFPETVTNLKSVDLNANRLTRFSMAMIGHNGKTLHSNLYELVLSENHQLREGDISTLLAQLPKSTQLVWVNSEPYDTSDIYVANELPNKYLTQRRKCSTDADDSDSDMESESGSDSDTGSERSDSDMESESGSDSNTDSEPSDSNMESESGLDWT